MPRLQSILASILVFALAFTPARAQHADRDRFLGAWHLVSLEQPGPDNQLHRVNATGLFVFTADGHLSVQVMNLDPQPLSPSSTQQYSQGGYEASYGTYTTDEKTHTFVFHVDGALVRSLIGNDLARHYEFSGNRLIIQSTHPDEHWRVIWERN